MGVYINGDKTAKPYINGVKYNGYINGKKIWGSYPPGAVLADSSGYVDLTPYLCAYTYYCTAEYRLYNHQGIVIIGDRVDYEGDRPIPSLRYYVGVGGYGLIVSCECNVD